MQNFDIPDYYYDREFSDKTAKPDVLEKHDYLMKFLHNVGEGKYFSQATIEGGWEWAFKDKIVSVYKLKHGRAPRAKFLQGVRYTQCRCIRIMFRDWKRGQDFSSGHDDTVSDAEVDDEALQSYLEAVGIQDMAEEQVY